MFGWSLCFHSFVIFHYSSNPYRETSTIKDSFICTVLYPQNKYTSNGVYSFLYCLVFKKPLCPCFAHVPFFVFVQSPAGLLVLVVPVC
jgi:hypothetical protein